MKSFVIAEHSDAAVELCAGARTLSDEVVLFCLCDAPAGASDKAYRIVVPEGAVADDAADSITPVFDAEQPGVVLAEPTRRAKVIAGKIAAHAGTAVITDAAEISAEGARSMYFGGVGERVRRAASSCAFYTVVPGTFAGLDASGTDACEDLAWVAPAKGVKLVSSSPVEKGGVDLTKAEAVVAAGRGFAEEADLELARELCDKIGAGLGCSRPLTEGVDWLPSETYIGVSGLMLSPKVYVACGISGQMQHMVGCNRSGVIFAINKDKNAPVFKQCDYGLVGDVKTVLPQLIAAL